MFAVGVVCCWTGRRVHALFSVHGHMLFVSTGEGVVGVHRDAPVAVGAAFRAHFRTFLFPSSLPLSWLFVDSMVQTWHQNQEQRGD